MDDATVSHRPDSGKRARPPPLIVAVAESTRYRGLRKLALMQLSLWGDPNGTRIFPSLKTVADMAGLDERTMRRHVRAFEQDGVLVVVARSRGGRSKPSEYRLDLGALNPDTGPPVHGVRNPGAGALNPDSDDRKPGHMTPPTLQDPSRPYAPTGSADQGQPDGADEIPVWKRELHKRIA